MMGIMAMDNLNEVFRWKLLDFHFSSDEVRQDAIMTGWFEPYNNIPIGLEVWRDKLFITVPRWKSGVAASLTYINLSGELKFFISEHQISVLNFAAYIWTNITSSSGGKSNL